MELELLDDTELAYLAGLFDGEGSVLVNKIWNKNCYTYRMRICISSTFLDVILWLKEILGGNISTNKVYGNRKESYVWQLGANSAADLLFVMLPYLRIKKEQALIGTEFQSTQKLGGGNGKYSQEELDYRKFLLEYLGTLNTKGPIRRR